MERLTRTALKEGLTSPLFGPAMKLGQLLRPAAAGGAEEQGAGARAARARTNGRQRAHTRKVLMLLGCVQPAMMPNINTATARVLDAAGIQTLVADGAGCCGAIRTHLNDADGGLDDMRRNIDAWWPLVEGPDQRRPGRGDRDERVGLRRHGQGLRPRAGARRRLRREGARISALTKDLSELLPELVRAAAKTQACAPRAGQAPAPSTRPARCSTASSCAAASKRSLRALGFEVSVAGEREPPVLRLGRHLSVLQPELAYAAARPQAGAPRARSSAPGHRLGQHRLHPAPADPAPPRRCGTGSRCSTTRCAR